MRLTPPNNTNATNIARIKTVIQTGIAKLPFKAVATELACTVLPIPKPAIIPKKENAIPSFFQRVVKPFLI